MGGGKGNRAGWGGGVETGDRVPLWRRWHYRELEGVHSVMMSRHRTISNVYPPFIRCLFPMFIHCLFNVYFRSLFSVYLACLFMLYIFCLSYTSFYTLFIYLFTLEINVFALSTKKSRQRQMQRKENIKRSKEKKERQGKEINIKKGRIKEFEK